MTPTVIQRLHEVLSAERVELGSHGHHDFDTWVWMTQRTDTVIAAVEQALAAKDAEIAELTKDAERWRSVRACAGLSVDEDGGVDLIAEVAEDTDPESTPWLTGDERRALDGELTRHVDGARNGWVWSRAALDGAADALTAQLYDGEDAEKARAEAPK